MVINILIVVLSILDGDVQDLNNWIEIGLWIASIAGLLSMRKWGAAFAIFTLSYTLSTSAGIVIYFLAIDPDLWPNLFRVIINVPIVIHLFKSIFAGKFR